jgi:hypothetical protein
VKRFLAIALLLSAAPAAAKETARYGTFDLKFSPYRPNIDAEFNGAATPYQDVFGTGRSLMFKAEVGFSLLQRYGSLDLGIGAGYFQDRGHGRLSTDGSESGDTTTLRIIPTTLFLTYRLDVLADRWSIPLVPYARVAFERWYWQITNGSGGEADFQGQSGRGATNGYSGTLGIAFLLDIIDPGLARDMDSNTGINSTYLYAEATKAVIDDFGSSSSMDLSPSSTFQYAFGLLFVF